MNDQPLSDLIEKLQHLKDMHGDVPVHVLYRNEGGAYWGFFTHKFEYPTYDSNTNAVYI